MNYQTRRLIIFVLLVLTLVLGGVSLYIGLNLGEGDTDDGDVPVAGGRCVEIVSPQQQPACSEVVCASINSQSDCNIFTNNCCRWVQDTLPACPTGRVCAQDPGGAQGYELQCDAGGQTGYCYAAGQTLVNGVCTNQQQNTCPQGYANGITQNTCLNSFCGDSYDPSWQSDSTSAGCCKCNPKSGGGDNGGGGNNGGGGDDNSGGTFVCPDDGTTPTSGCFVFLCPNGCGADNQCAGGDEGATLYYDPTCTATTGATLDGRCGQIDYVKGGGIGSGQYCGIKAITCGTPACDVTEPDVITYTCNRSNYACEPVTGTGGEYTTEAACDANCFEPNEELPPVQCGETCTVDSQCPVGNTCSNGTCKLNTCANNPSLCNPNGCSIAPIPSTAIGDNPRDFLLIGMLFMLGGLAVYKFSAYEKLIYGVSGFSSNISSFFSSMTSNKKSKEEKQREKHLKKLEKDRDSFEKSFEDRD